MYKNAHVQVNIEHAEGGGLWFKHILFFINCNIHTHIYIVYNKSWD